MSNIINKYDDNNNSKADLYLFNTNNKKMSEKNISI